jgi:hypothetical protein
MNKNDITLTGLTTNQVFICEMLWKMPSMNAVDDLCRAGGPEFYAMRDLIVAEQYDKVTEVRSDVAEYLTRF